jgi:hypothetical protein
MKKRIRSVTVFSILYFVSSVTTIYSIFTIDSRVAEYAGGAVEFSNVNMITSKIWSGLDGVASFGIAIALWKVARWARVSVIIHQVVYVAYSLIYFIIFSYLSLVPQLESLNKSTLPVYVVAAIGLVWPLFVLWFFNRSDIKEQFAQEAQPNHAMSLD